MAKKEVPENRKTKKTVHTGAPLFEPGQSGNPGGRPKLPELFKQKGPEALQKIVSLMKSRNEKMAFQAATYIADRVYGKAKESVEHSGAIAATLTQEQIDAIYRARNARLERSE